MGSLPSLPAKIPALDGLLRLLHFWSILSRGESLRTEQVVRTSIGRSADCAAGFGVDGAASGRPQRWPWAEVWWVPVAAGAYETYEGSPMSKGQLQHDLWGVEAPSSRWDWSGLRADIAQHGVRNSLLVAPMPTASTSQVRLRMSLHVSLLTLTVHARHGTEKAD